ncbi:MAG: hypothetical protein EPN46_11585 [Candidimonas sp.]|nr:MAG: hypothetical protein EPN77_00285 [Candidimonas sp.]TAM20729.1 MAG: hypothetical protein EPN62_16235 [Candidimonas sp.]TAM74825.1 MAG: hypothetical protein EPN46_11585 [Candidimonas sp.]
MRYIATGRVHPERADIRFGPIEWEILDQGRVIAQCDSSQITVLLELAPIDGWATAYVTAEHFAIIVIGALGFSLGSGYAVELIQVTEEDGTPHVFGVRPTGDTPDQTLGFNPHGPIFNRAFRLANQNVFFRLALRDFLRAITDIIDCATYCYRAIESLKSAFVSKSGNDRWDEMHAALGTDRATIDAAVKNYADPVRHGNWVSAPPTDSQTRWQMLLLTRDILLKYLDHELPAA